MLSVFMLFLLPVGGGIPAGVLLARANGLSWPVTAGLYLFPMWSWLSLLNRFLDYWQRWDGKFDSWRGAARS